MEGINKTNGFELLKGQKRVLLSAPHAYDHRRPSLTTSLKQAEPWTDLIAHEVASNTGSLGILQRGQTEYDPNYHKERQNPYKKGIRNLDKDEPVEYILDIHGLSDQYPLDIVIFYPIRYRRSRKIADMLSSHLDKGDLRDLSIHIFNFSSPLQESISEFAAGELKIPSIQIEIARYIREEEKLRKALIESLSTFIALSSEEKA